MASPGPSCNPIRGPCLCKSHVLPRCFDNISEFECGNLNFLEELFEILVSDKT